MNIGAYAVSHFNFGMFRLDGGAMFGSVPKTLWSREIAGDNDNCIPLATRTLVLKGHGRVVLIDVGMGEKWSEKQKGIYGLQNTPESAWGVSREEVTDVILTHLHFDHAGGISRLGSGGELELTFPNASIHLQRGNWEYAHSPCLKDKASYLAENITPIKAGSLVLHDGTGEIVPGVIGHCVHGHTKGQQWVEIVGMPQSIFVATDVVPTRHHLPIPFHMGYDLCAETILQEKTAFLERAASENHVVFFIHDPEVPAVTVKKDEKGRFTVDSVVNF